MAKFAHLPVALVFADDLTIKNGDFMGAFMGISCGYDGILYSFNYIYSYIYIYMHMYIYIYVYIYGRFHEVVLDHWWICNHGFEMCLEMGD